MEVDVGLFWGMTLRVTSSAHAVVLQRAHLQPQTHALSRERTPSAASAQPLDFECTSTRKLPSMESMRIGEVSQATGLSTSTLRYYEREGLITVARDYAGRRLYDPQDVSWIRFLQRLRATNMPIGLMRRYARLRAAGPSTLAERLELLEGYEAKVRIRISELSAHAKALEKKIAVYRQWIDDAKSSKQPTAP